MKEMDEVQQFAEELEDEEFMDDLEEYDEEIEDEEDTELKISDLTEEELQALQLLQELASVSEKLWNAHIVKLLEYSKTHEVKMRKETVTTEYGEMYTICSAFLPNEKEEDGIWIPLEAEKVKRVNKDRRKRDRTIPIEEFFVPVKGRAESRHTQKIREYARRLDAIITRNRIELAKNVDIRQKATDAKEEYYQFDKTIKNKNKDINAIKAQIAALEGTTNAAAKAKLEQLKADLAEKEEDLEDTKHDHEIDLISKGYDNLTDQADKALDNTLNAVKSNSQMQTAVIEEMLKTTKQKYKDAYAEINQIIADTGLKVSDQFQNNIKDSNLKNEQTDKKKADKAVTGIKDTKVSGSTGTGSTAADKVIRNAATDAQNKILKKLTLSPKSVVVNVGKTATVKVSFSPSTAVNKNFNCTASAKGIVKITQAADSITLKGLKAGKTVIKVQGAGGYCKAVSLNVSVLKDAMKNSKIVNSTAKSKKYTLTTEEKNRVLNMSTGQNANTVKANTKKEAELKKWYAALPAYTGGDAEIEKIKDPVVKHFAKKGKKTSNANIVKAASILGYKDAKNVSKWDTKKKNALVKKLQTFGFSKGGVIRNLIPATMGTLLGDAIIKNGDTGFIGAKPGETVLTQDFTKLLKPTTAIMQEFTDVMQNAGSPNIKEVPARQEVTMNNEYQFVINGVDVNDMSELKKVIRGELDKHDKQLAKEFKKFR